MWVFKENYSARHFYEKYGFISTEEFSSCTLDETAVPEIKYVCKKQEDSGKNILNIILQKYTTPSVTLFISARFLTSCRQLSSGEQGNGEGWKRTGGLAEKE